MAHSPSTKSTISVNRIRLISIVLTAILVIFGLRLFYVQVIRYNHYEQAALNDQLKQYQIPATRGLIELKEGNNIVPIVLNQKLYTLFADPPLIKHPKVVAEHLSTILGGSPNSYMPDLTAKYTQYVVIAHQLTQTQSNKIANLQDPGLGTQGQDARVYPDGDLAAQVLGFVNPAGHGEYGIEQAMNKQLAGTNGELKAITDVNGVPLAASKQNTQIAPIPGKNVVLTLNIGMQEQMQSILAKEYKATKSQGLSAIIINPYNGHIKAMANYPTYSPANYQAVTNEDLFQNAAVDYPIEPGSIMKTLTTPAALNDGAITPNESFFDPAHWVINGFNIHDISIDGGPREQTIATILALSLNTGATWMLMQMSHKGTTYINARGIKTWHNYMVNHYRLGQITGIQQGYEASGYVPPANMKDPTIDLRYANTAFGQGVSMTALQIVTALSSVINGGTYYQPSLVDEVVSDTGQVVVNKPKVLERNVVSPKVGKELIPLMEGVIKAYLYGGFKYLLFPNNYIVGGKTGTAQVAKPSGGYYKNIYNGSYIGFVGGNKPQYLIVVYNIKPRIPGYSGAQAAQPVFADLVHMLINQGYVMPRN